MFYKPWTPIFDRRNATAPTQAWTKQPPADGSSRQSAWPKTPLPGIQIARRTPAPKPLGPTAEASPREPAFEKKLEPSRVALRRSRPFGVIPLLLHRRSKPPGRRSTHGRGPKDLGAPRPPSKSPRARWTMRRSRPGGLPIDMLSQRASPVQRRHKPAFVEYIEGGPP